jgi:hypothetical protein
VSPNRKPQVLRQSPGLIAKTDRPGPSYKTQLNAIVNKEEEPEVYRALAAEPGDHAHHKLLLETLDRLFDDLDEKGQADLRDHIINKHGVGIGNHILNLINMPGEIHQGGIHKFAREMGYEIDAKSEPKGLALDILEASTVPSVEYRKHIADKYINEAFPAMRNEIDDLLTEHYATASKFGSDSSDDLMTSYKQKGAKRFAGEDPKVREYMQAIESGRDTQSTGAVSGDKPVVVHAGEGSKVFLQTNGNGPADMQRTFRMFD